MISVKVEKSECTRIEIIGMHHDILTEWIMLNRAIIKKLAEELDIQESEMLTKLIIPLCGLQFNEDLRKTEETKEGEE